ncbi:MAG: S8 family peptidase [Chitinophagaceae bacterium]|nr:S8 family peptidase [Chitinophagaceae bacterium]
MTNFIRASICALCVISGLQNVSAQSTARPKNVEVPKGWHLLDKEKDGHYGISLNKAYDFIQSKKLKGKTVLVAVIDSGIDTLHEDLKEIIWKNPGEIAGNGIDDDKNGYVDDIYGWNFLGNKDGRNVEKDSYEAARIYHSLKTKYQGRKTDTTQLSVEDKEEYKMWVNARNNVIGVGEETVDLFELTQAIKIAKRQDTVLCKAMGKEEYTGNDIEKFEPTTQTERIARNYLLSLFKGNNMMDISNKDFIDGFEDFAKNEAKKAEQRDKAPVDYRTSVTGDNENDIKDINYGNNNVMVSLDAAEHGTHVSGIIAAVRKNGKGMDGIADNVRIMMLRAVPDGDEHDKDIALAIRYAADNGAKVINMSFGKSFSPQKKWVDEAVQYAASKGVLLVHAAGNDHKNVDSSDNFPNPVFAKTGTKASNWVTVGANGSGAQKDDGVTAYFSNYGKDGVDVFAPGANIYATFPGGNVYRSLDGTSMASPVVAGTAAFLLSYFPYLTPEQVKECIEKSAQAPAVKVKKPGSAELVDLSEISRTGGIINTYEAAKIAASMQPAGVPEKKKSPKPTLSNKKG